MRENLPLPGEVLCEVVMVSSEPQLVAARFEQLNTPLLCWDAAWIEVGDPLVYCEQGTGLKMVLLYALNSSP